MFRPLANNDLFRPLADKGKDKGKGCKGGKPIDIVVRPLADNGKDKGKGCNGGKPTDIEEFPVVIKFLRFPSSYDFPEHKRGRAAGLVNKLFALLDPFNDMTTEDEETMGGEEAARKALIQKIEETEDERMRLLQQLRELREESAEESEAGSGAAGSSSSKQARQKGRAEEWKR